MDINNQILLEACRTGEFETVRLLLKHEKVDPNVISSTAKTPCIVLAASSGNWELVQALIDAGADINKKMEGTGVSVLHAVAASCCSNHQNNNNVSPSSIDYLKSLDIFFLAHQQKNVNSSSTSSSSSSSSPPDVGHNKNKSFVDCETTRDGLTPLFFAAKIPLAMIDSNEHGRRQRKIMAGVVSRLLNAGADCFKLSSPSSGSMSIFHVCARSGNFVALEALLRFHWNNDGIILQLCDLALSLRESLSGKTAKEIAVQKGHENVIEILEGMEKIMKNGGGDAKVGIFDFIKNSDDEEEEEKKEEASPSPPPPQFSPPAEGTLQAQISSSTSDSTAKNNNKNNINHHAFDPFVNINHHSPNERRSSLKSLFFDESPNNISETTTMRDNNNISSTHLNKTGRTPLQQKLFEARNKLLNEPQDHLEQKQKQQEQNTNGNDTGNHRFFVDSSKIDLFGPTGSINSFEEGLANKNNNKDDGGQIVLRQLSLFGNDDEISLNRNDKEGEVAKVETKCENEAVIPPKMQENKENNNNNNNEESFCLSASGNKLGKMDDDDDDDEHQEGIPLDLTESNDDNEEIEKGQEENDEAQQQQQDLDLSESHDDDNDDDESDKKEHCDKEREKTNEIQLQLQQHQQQALPSTIDDIFVPIQEEHEKSMDYLFGDLINDKNNKNEKKVEIKPATSIEDVLFAPNENCNDESDKNSTSTSSSSSICVTSQAATTIIKNSPEVRNSSKITRETNQLVDEYLRNQNANQNGNDDDDNESFQLRSCATAAPPEPRSTHLIPQPLPRVTIKNIKNLPQKCKTELVKPKTVLVPENLLISPSLHHQEQNAVSMMVSPVFLSPTNSVAGRRHDLSWLRFLDLPQEAKDILRREKIEDENDFYELSDEDLKSIGMPLGYRKKILKLIKEMKSRE